MKIVSHLLITLFAALFVLLAIQAEPVTATLGFIAAGILTLAVIISVVKPRA